MMELTPPEVSDLAIDLWAIYTLFLSEAIGASVTQSARGVSVLYKCVLRGIRVAKLWVAAAQDCSLRELHQYRLGLRCTSATIYYRVYKQKAFGMDNVANVLNMCLI